MSSNQLRLLLLSVMAVFAISAVASASASASTPGCYRVAVAGTGAWEKSTCLAPAGTTKEYVMVEKVETQLKPGEWCAKVKAGEPSRFSNNTCTTAHAGTGEFTTVIATCYMVAVAGTGNYSSSEKCEKKEASSPKEWVMIEKMENQVEPGVWCAKVKTGEPSTFKDNKCTEAETSTGKFIKVKVSQDQWQTCQEKAGGMFEEHGCAKTGTTKAFEWVTLAAGKTEKVISSGGEFKLTSGVKVITCKKVKDEGTITGGSPGTDEATKITFEECTTSQTGCKVKSAGGKLGTIEVTGIKTTLKQFLVGEEEIEGDVFEQKTVENAKKELIKEFVTLQFEAEAGKSCSEFPETKVKGDVVAETAANSGELTFPSTPIEVSPKLEAFAIKATLTGKDTQTLTNGWAIRAI